MNALFTDEQIISIITEQVAGENTADVCRLHALPSRALQSKVPRIGPYYVKRLRALEHENGKLKKLLAVQCWTTPC